jgi:hypothetical protein
MNLPKDWNIYKNLTIKVFKKSTKKVKKKKTKEIFEAEKDDLKLMTSHFPKV